MDIRAAFTSYTKLMFDITSGAAAGLLHQGVELSTLFATRCQRLRSTTMYKTREAVTRLHQLDITNSVSFSLIEQRLNNLRYQDFSKVNETQSLKQTLQDLLKFMQSDEAIQKVIYLMPKENNGLILIANCLFSESSEIQKLAAKLL